MSRRWSLQYLPESRATLEQAIDLRLALREALFPLGALRQVLISLQEAKELAEALGDQQRLGWVSVCLIAHFAQACDPARALAAGQRALAIAVALGNSGLTVMAQYYLGAPTAVWEPIARRWNTTERP